MTVSDPCWHPLRECRIFPGGIGCCVYKQHSAKLVIQIPPYEMFTLVHSLRHKVHLEVILNHYIDLSVN